METKTYDKSGNHIRSEKLLTLAEYVRFGRLKPGQLLTLAKIDEEAIKTAKYIWAVCYDNENLVVGHCTPRIQPITNDLGLGWNWDSELCKKYVIEIQELI